jgi:hypothetical protein
MLSDLAPRLRALTLEVARDARAAQQTGKMLDKYLDFHSALTEWVTTTDYPDAADEVLALMNELLPPLPTDSTQIRLVDTL